MTQLERIGFFRELRHGRADGPSIHDAIREPMRPSDREAVAAYLEAGAVLVATSERADDVLDPTRQAVSPINRLTDGVYVWSQDLAYYVRTYGAAVPDDLVARANAGPPPTFTESEVMELAEAFSPPPPD
ncbi:hypothetical protein [Cellulomonas sp. URHD0024]|uniref:hypothetical protein n=1 Tax=Cellulomonas sp. URHD0024 TaxID=1302620 RepID=UPI0006852E4D|nr:hypothetical protein [Cellulomonas sp. URHD0024]